MHSIETIDRADAFIKEHKCLNGDAYQWWKVYLKAMHGIERSLQTGEDIRWPMIAYKSCTDRGVPIDVELVLGMFVIQEKLVSLEGDMSAYANTKV